MLNVALIIENTATGSQEGSPVSGSSTNLSTGTSSSIGVDRQPWFQPCLDFVGPFMGKMWLTIVNANSK